MEIPECDYETGYFLEHGKYPPPIERKCQYGLSDNDIDYHIHNDYVDEYYCWQGRRIPLWFE